MLDSKITPLPPEFPRLIWGSVANNWLWWHVGGDSFHFPVLSVNSYLKKCCFHRNDSQDISLRFAHCHGDGGGFSHTNSSSHTKWEVIIELKHSMVTEQRARWIFEWRQLWVGFFLSLPFLSFPACFCCTEVRACVHARAIKLRCKYQCRVCNKDEHVNESIIYSDCLFVFMFWAPIGDSCLGHNNHSTC